MSIDYSKFALVIIIGLICGDLSYIISQRLLQRTYNFNPLRVGIDILSAILFLLIVYFEKDWLNQIILLLFTMALLIIIITDFMELAIFDQILLTLTILGVFYSFYNNDSLIKTITLPAIITAIVLLLRKATQFVIRKETLGMGDVKLFAIAGLYLSAKLISTFFILTGIIGIITALIWANFKTSKEFPLGPAICISLFLCVIFPSLNELINFLIGVS
jgi:leader peptidase (prepilin peptidase)/N-methyltransferase